MNLANLDRPSELGAAAPLQTPPRHLFWPWLFLGLAALLVAVLVITTLLLGEAFQHAMGSGLDIRIDGERFTLPAGEAAGWAVSVALLAGLAVLVVVPLALLMALLLAALALVAGVLVALAITALVLSPLWVAALLLWLALRKPATGVPAPKA